MRLRVRLAIPLLFALAACVQRSDLGPTTGSIAITVNGLPSGPAAVTVSGPSGYIHSVTASTTLSGLTSGSYTVYGTNVVVGNGTYTPSASATVNVTASNTAVPVTVTYTLSSGALALTVSGLPGGVSGNVSVTGPGGFSATATATTTYSNITPGSYTITANVVSSGASTYGGSPATQTVNVPISLTPAPATVTYSLMTGTLAVTISGTPGGLAPSVLVTGPFAYSHPITVTGLTTLSALPLGTYTTSAANVSNATATYTPSPTSQSAGIVSGSLNQSATVTYAISTGSLTVTITGLPCGACAVVTVTGPASFSQSPTATTTYNKLVPGTYTVTASNVSSGGNTYTPNPLTQSPVVTASVTPATATVAYAIAVGADLTIDGLMITQSTQSYTDTVPLITGKDGYLRVFVKSNQANAVQPKVRVRWYSSGVLVRTDTINAPTASVPLVMSQATLGSSWNLAVPKALIAPNLSVLADVDPGNLIAETDKTNNKFPLSGVAKALDVRNVKIFHQMMVPVKVAKAGTTGNVNAGNMASYIAFPMKIWPLTTAAQVLHAVYTTTDTTDTLQSGDGNGMWGTTLSEITTLRFAEATTPVLDSTYYYGVVHPGYGGGVAGVAWVGGLQTAIGWDRGSNDQILAHETGHNWGNSHAWGCGATGNDATYPNTTGKIDAFGFDPATLTQYDTASYYDVMSYCKPSWVSNHMYIDVLNYRQSNKDIAADMSSNGNEPVMIVWGRMVNGKLVLEPAFEVNARAHLPAAGGAYTIEGLDAGGGRLFSYAFDGYMMMDTHNNMSSGFAFAIPTRNFDVSRLSALRLAGPEGEARVTGGPAVAAMKVGAAPPAQISARALGGKMAKVSWDASYPMAMIRDAATGQVLSFARGSSIQLEVPGQRLIVTLSDGVRSVTQVIDTQ